MSKDYTEDVQFKSENFNERSLPIGEYDHCGFSECNFLNADLSEIIFTNCRFSNCDLSIDPEKNRIQKAKFSMQNIAGLLHKYNIKITP